MQTGRQTLATIEGTIDKLHEEESRIDGALRSAADHQEQLRKDRGEALRELARVKLGEMAAGRLVNQLDAAEQRAQQIIEDRKLRLAALGQRRTTAITEVSVAEAERHAAGARVEEALAAVETVREGAERRVRTQANWQSAKAALETASAIATEADKKAGQSETELGTKKKPYDQDSLFIYLWNRNFGTGRYAAGNIARMMDRTVADFIGFSGARANYAMLIEIPARLREHASAKKMLATQAQTALAAIERAAMVADGIDAKERALAEVRHQLASAETTLEAKRGQLASIDTERETLLSEQGDAAYQQAIATISAGDAQDDFATLYREARRTATLADETLVRRIEQIDQLLAAALSEAGNLRRSANELARKRLEVENVRDRFRSSGYDHPHVTFGNESDIGRILSSILEGAVRSGILWDVIRGGFSTRGPRGRPEFGSPSFPFPFPIPGGGDRGPRGGGWREPSSQGGWFPPADSSGGSGGSGSGDDDSFSTGGSF
jgi:hypothetical protein